MIDLATQYVENAPSNRITDDEAITPDLAGLRLFDAPIFGIADAGDALFEGLKSPQAVGPHHGSPGEWLPGARSVASFFLPFTQRVREANRRDARQPADEWLHGRIEGQRFIGELLRMLAAALCEAGGEAIAPSVDARFASDTSSFTSNWSERHVAYIAGLGTFGLSKGLITERGVAGRFGSVVTTFAWAPTPRPYGDLYEYCTRCGACARRCPAGAISLESGKRHAPCSDFVDAIRDRYAPRYGCGKCQTQVPCEAVNPTRGKRDAHG